MCTVREAVAGHGAATVRVSGLLPCGKPYRVYGRTAGRRLVATGQRIIIATGGRMLIQPATHRSRIRFGAHHSHFQPRDTAGRFVSYATSGQAIDRHAAALGCAILLAQGRVWLVPSTAGYRPIKPSTTPSHRARGVLAKSRRPRGSRPRSRTTVRVPSAGTATSPG